MVQEAVSTSVSNIYMFDSHTEHTEVWSILLPTSDASQAQIQFGLSRKLKYVPGNRVCFAICAPPRQLRASRALNSLLDWL